LDISRNKLINVLGAEDEKKETTYQSVIGEFNKLPEKDKNRIKRDICE
jgi:hypothetical protein